MGFYGFPECRRKRDSWDLLHNLAKDNSLLWCMIGHFSDMLTIEDKYRGQKQPQWLISGFREVVKDCKLVDLPLEGYQYTWIQKRGTMDVTKERLEKALANQALIYSFPQCRLTNIMMDRFDHLTIVLSLESNFVKGECKVFRFENAWLEEEDLPRVVEKSWVKYPFTNLMGKINHYVDGLGVWGRNIRMCFHAKIDKCRRELEKYRGRRHVEGIRKYVEVREIMGSWLAKEDGFWRQREKTHWFRDGDTNFKFFHPVASARKKHNRISKL